MRYLLSCCVLWLWLAAALAAPPQRNTPPVQRPSDPQFGQRRNQEQEDAERRLEKERAKRLNKERQEALKRDTDKLFALATELKERVDKSNENLLSLDVIRKAEEIEKLAKSVKEKMKSE